MRINAERLIAGAALLLALAACSTAPDTDTATSRPPAPVRSSGGAPVATPEESAVVRPSPSLAAGPEQPPQRTRKGGARIGPAAAALVKQAEVYAREGDGERAAATLERAIRIEPDNAWTWHYLSVLRMQQGLWREAVDTAFKSNSLSGGDAALLGGNWKVIATARERLGDREGAAEARRRAESYLPER